MTYKHVAFVVTTFIFLVGCTVRDGTSFAPSTTTPEAGKTPISDPPTISSSTQFEPTTTTTPQQPMDTPTAVSSTHLPAPTATVENEASPVVITGTVQGIMLSAWVIVLQEPAQGFTDVALTQETKLVSAEGLEIAFLRDLQVGTEIRAIGHPGTTPGALIAEEVCILP